MLHMRRGLLRDIGAHSHTTFAIKHTTMQTFDAHTQCSRKFDLKFHQATFIDGYFPIYSSLHTIYFGSQILPVCFHLRLETGDLKKVEWDEGGGHPSSTYSQGTKSKSCTYITAHVQRWAYTRPHKYTHTRMKHLLKEANTRCLIRRGFVACVRQLGAHVFEGQHCW